MDECNILVDEFQARQQTLLNFGIIQSGGQNSGTMSVAPAAPERA